MDASTTTALFSLAGGVLTVGGAIFTAVRASKSKSERLTDQSVAEATQQKLRAEKNDIVETTTSRAVQRIQTQLDRKIAELDEAEKKLEAADERAEKYRKALIESNDRAYLQDIEIRRALRRARALEEWIENNAAALGLDGLPPDILDDRRHREADG